MAIYVGAAVAVALILVLGAALFYVLRRRRGGPTTDETLAYARLAFRQRREWLEADFLSHASQSGRPRGLAWVDCDFENEVAFARDRHSGNLRALVGVSIRFEAVEGGGMEDNPNVGNIRAATAVFRFDGLNWATDGRTLFNLNPSEAIAHFQHELELVEQQ